LRKASPYVRKHALVALANLSKFLGCYHYFRQLREASSLKWEKTSAITSFLKTYQESVGRHSRDQKQTPMEILFPGCLHGFNPFRSFN